MSQTSPPASPQRDPKSVFLVHGRDTRPYKVLETFLHFIGLTVMSWSTASSLTNKAQPSTYEIVKAGIDAAGATIVIWSPDDEGRLKEQHAGGDTDATQTRSQARQNVILEAGLAYGTGPDRTIFVQSEAGIRWPSDVDGFNWVKLDGEWDSRKLLIERLTRAGAEPRPHDVNLQARLAGPFKVD